MELQENSAYESVHAAGLYSGIGAGGKSKQLLERSPRQWLTKRNGQQQPSWQNSTTIPVGRSVLKPSAPAGEFSCWSASILSAGGRKMDVRVWLKTHPSQVVANEIQNEVSGAMVGVTRNGSPCVDIPEDKKEQLLAVLQIKGVEIWTLPATPPTTVIRPIVIPLTKPAAA